MERILAWQSYGNIRLFDYRFITTLITRNEEEIFYIAPLDFQQKPN